jgi:ComF family protein
LSAFAATGEHAGKLREAVQALKYDNVRAIADFMARRMAQALDSLDWQFDVILPVPIGSARLRERRYNQAGLIAAALAREVGVAFQPTLIWRTRETRSQVGLTAEERQLNVAHAFAAHPTLLADQSILLIDDVYTTGATLHACAEALRAVGARQVYALTVTAAQHQ